MLSSVMLISRFVQSVIGTDEIRFDSTAATLAHTTSTLLKWRLK
jgi:hypothetical protein